MLTERRFIQLRYLRHLAWIAVLSLLTSVAAADVHHGNHHQISGGRTQAAPVVKRLVDENAPPLVTSLNGDMQNLKYSIFVSNADVPLTFISCTGESPEWSFAVPGLGELPATVSGVTVSVENRPNNRTLFFDPGFIAELEGVYTCNDTGLGIDPEPSYRLTITADNPYLQLVTPDPLYVSRSTDSITVDLRAFYSDPVTGFTVRASASNISASYQPSGGGQSQQDDLVLNEILSLDPELLRLSVLISGEIAESSTFTFTLQPFPELSATVSLKVVTPLPDLPLVAESSVDCSPVASNLSVEWTLFGDIYQSDSLLTTAAAGGFLGPYTCQLVGMPDVRETVYVIPAPVAILSSDETPRAYVDGAVINDIVESSELGLKCFSVEGHGNRRWKTDSDQINFAIAPFDDKLNMGPQNATVGPLTIVVEYTDLSAEITFIPAYAIQENTVTCVSEESGLQREVIVTTENPYVRLFPTNPTEVKLGSPAAFQYTIAGFSDGFINVPEEVIDFEIIPSVDPSPSSLLSNLLQDETNPYVFSYSLQSAGTYDNGTYRFIEFSSTVLVSYDLTVKVPELNVVPVSPLIIQAGEKAVLECTSPDPTVTVLWQEHMEEDDYYGPELEQDSTFDVLNGTISFYPIVSDTEIYVQPPFFFPPVLNIPRVGLPSPARFRCTFLFMNESFEEPDFLPEHATVDVQATRGPVQIINVVQEIDQPEMSVYLYNNAIVNRFRPLFPTKKRNIFFETRLVLQCLATLGQGQPRWRSSVPGVSEYLENQGGEGEGYYDTGTNTELFVRNTSPGISTLTVNTGGDAISPNISGLYECVSEDNAEKSTVTILTENKFLEGEVGVLKAPLGSLATLPFRFAFDSDGSSARVNVEETFELTLTPTNGNDSLTLIIESLQVFHSNELYLAYVASPNDLVVYVTAVSTRNTGVYTLERAGLTTNITLSGIVPKLTTPNSLSLTVNERDSLTLTCAPDAPGVQIIWRDFSPEVDLFTDYIYPSRRFVDDYNENDIGFVHFANVVYNPPELRHTATFSNWVPCCNNITFTCEVFGDVDGAVPPIQFAVRVLRNCDEEFSGGVFWPLTEEGDTVYAPCSAVSTRFSDLVMMSRTCYSGDYWSPVDYSDCTIADLGPPFLLVSIYFQSFTNISHVQGMETNITDQLVEAAAQNLIVLSNTLLSTYTSEAGRVGVVLEAEIDPLDVYSTSPAGVPYYFGANLVAQFSTIDVFVATDVCNCVDTASANNEPIDPQSPPSTDLPPPEPPEMSGMSGEPPIFFFTPSPVYVLCIGAPVTPCECIDGSCTCISPYVGNGTDCTLDSDLDGYPDVPLDCSSDSTDNMPYCQADVCVEVYNPLQEESACDFTKTQPTDCPSEIDDIWGVLWPVAPSEETVTQHCPGGVNTIGLSERRCSENGEWERPNVSNCKSRRINVINTRANNFYRQSTYANITRDNVTESTDIVKDIATETGNETSKVSILPSDIETLTNILNDSVALLMIAADMGIPIEGTSDAYLNAFDNLLQASNEPGWNDLEEEMEPVASLLLDTTEDYALLLASNTNETVVYIGESIVLTAGQVDVSDVAAILDVVFPAVDLLDYTDQPPASITVPASLMLERAGNSNSVPVANILFLTLQDFLPTNRSESEPATVVISSQVGVQMGIGVSQALQENPVSIVFSINDTAYPSYDCVFWDFETTSWSGENLDEELESGLITCNSTHLTSFAVLVGVGDTQGVLAKALSIISYIGCAISLACLLLTIIFFLSFGKALFTSVHNFVHLNLAITLFIAFLVFALGIELAKDNEIACKSVAFLLHYFWLSAFSWMLCEGVMLYLMLVVVFSRLSKKWWFFVLLGYGLPLPFVATGFGAFFSGYGVKNSEGEYTYCWLSNKDAIWFFVAPIIAISIINFVFLVLVLVALYRTTGSKLKREKDSNKTRDTVIKLIKGAFILLPLLGLTWLFGLFAINEDLIVFAWLFAICNSLQGLFIFIFHVLRNERIWGKLRKKYKGLSSTSGKSRKSEPTGSTVSGTRKKNLYTVTSEGHSSSATHNGKGNSEVTNDSVPHFEEPEKKETLQTETQTFFQRFSPAVEEQRVEKEKERENLKPNLKPRKDMESFRLAFNVSGSEAPEIDDELSPLTPVREETTAT